ncbi:3258_t:CDS:2 [Funneliformis geosporum]|nr:3258_t:CDS:2 [Funneliformis geosporum]
MLKPFSEEQLKKLIKENSRLQAQLEAITEGGGIKIIFPDKAIAKQIIRLVKPRILKELLRYSLNSTNSPNLVLEGDNLHALVSLYQYRNKVDLILTDPPYNTGKDFRYNDKQNELPNDEELGDLIKEDDPAKHTNGVLAICIDERELFNLGKMLDEVFGEENRISIINWQKTVAAKNQMKHISPAVEYILIYAKNFEQAKTARIARTPAMIKRYKNPDNDLSGSWVADNPTSGPPSKANIYAIQNPFTEEYGSNYREFNLQESKAKALILEGANEYENIEKNLVVEKAQAKAEKRLKEGN